VVNEREHRSDQRADADEDENWQVALQHSKCDFYLTS
jgi:hypothetical protein